MLSGRSVSKDKRKRQEKHLATKSGGAHGLKLQSQEIIEVLLPLPLVNGKAERRTPNAKRLHQVRID